MGEKKSESMSGTENMTMGELLKMREELGAKQFEEQVSVPKLRKLKRAHNPDYQPRQQQHNDSSKVARKEPLVKHAPEEISSKKRPPKMRQLVETEEEKVTDPRFKEDVTKFSQIAFDKRFGFVADMEKRERDQLSKKLRKVKNKELKGDIHKLINRIDQKAETRKERVEIRERETEMKRTEREKQVETGKQAYYHKQGTVGKEYRAEKEQARQAEQNEAQARKSAAKKEKKTVQREKKSVPQMRRNAE